MWHILLHGIRNVARHPRRSLLVGSAVAVVVLAQVVVFGLLESARQNAQGVASTLFMGELNVVGLFKPSPTRVFRLLPDPAALEKVVRQAVPELTELTLRDYGASSEATVSTATHALPNPVFLIGLDIAREGALRDYLKLEAGRLEELEKPYSVVLPSIQAKRLQVGVGDLVTLSSKTLRGVHNTVDVQVVGISAPLGSMSSEVVLVPRAVTSMLYRTQPEMASMVQLRLPPDADLEEVEARLRTALGAAGLPMSEPVFEDWFSRQQRLQSEPWVGQRYEVVSWKSDFEWQVSLIEALQVLAAFLSVLLLVIALAGLSNTLWVAIRERTREIGTLRAIGMRRGEVVLGFVSEGMALGLLGALAGVALGGVAGLVLDTAEFATPSTVQMYLGMGERLQLALHLPYLWRLTWLTTGFAALSSLLPSLGAARLKPVTAMGHTS